MAEWSIIAAPITILPHPNADRLEIAKVGPYGLVVQKGTYRAGDVVVFAPQRTIIPDMLRDHYVNADTGVSYLVGANHDRVGRIRLRGEWSEGVTLDPAWVCVTGRWPTVADIPQGVNLAEALGLARYEPPIPASLAGDVERLDAPAWWRAHDVETFRLYAGEFAPGEPVLVTEKIHGSQVNCVRSADGTRQVASKGLSARGLALQFSAANLYWRAAAAVDLWGILDRAYPGQSVQVIGEAFPCQGAAFRYGAIEPTLRVFAFGLDGDWTYDHHDPGVDPALAALWVPVLYRGPYSEGLADWAKGTEAVSGYQTGIREGIVISPAVPRFSTAGFPLLLKIINPKFKDSEEWVS